MTVPISVVLLQADPVTAIWVSGLALIVIGCVALAAWVFYAYSEYVDRYVSWKYPGTRVPPMYSEEFLSWDIQRKITSVPFLPPKDLELRGYWSVAMRRCVILFVVLIGSLLLLFAVAEIVEALT